MEWLTERAKESVSGLHRALKSAEPEVPERARAPFASLLIQLLTVLKAVDELLDALRSNRDEPAPKPKVSAHAAHHPRADEEEEETPDAHTPPRR